MYICGICRLVSTGACATGTRFHPPPSSTTDAFCLVTVQLATIIRYAHGKHNAIIHTASAITAVQTKHAQTTVFALPFTNFSRAWQPSETVADVLYVTVYHWQQHSDSYIQYTTTHDTECCSCNVPVDDTKQFSEQVGSSATNCCVNAMNKSGGSMERPSTWLVMFTDIML